MKKSYLKVLAMLGISLLLSSCVTTSYIGDRFNATSNVDVFYAEKDVKKEYKVIGHIYASTAMSADLVKESIINKGKAIGADAVIILGLATKGTGTDGETIQQADAIKYTQN